MPMLVDLRLYVFELRALKGEKDLNRRTNREKVGRDP